MIYIIQDFRKAACRFWEIVRPDNTKKHNRYLNYRGWGKFQKFPSIVNFGYDFAAIKRRVDLIPNLVETVKGYAKHEEGTLTGVIEARNKALAATTPEEEMKAAGEVTQALSKLLALTEAYPDLKANENFMDLQNNLKDTEDKISFARQFYNDAVLKYKNKIEMFPSNIVASLFKFQPE